MYLTLGDVILLFCIIQAVTFSLFLLHKETVRNTSNQLLAIVLFCFAAAYTEVFLYGTGISLQQPGLAYLGTIISLVQPGAFYLYSKSLMFSDFRLRKKDLRHLLLALIAGVFIVAEYYLQPRDLKVEMLMQRDFPGVLTSPLLAFIIHACVLAYYVATIRMLNRFGLKLRDLFSDIDDKLLYWLRLLLIGYLLIWMMILVYCLFAHIFSFRLSVRTIVGFSAVTGFVFINYLLFHALRQPGIFSGLSQEETALISISDPADGDESVVDRNEIPEALLARINDYMCTQKPYLYSNLSISDLAKKLQLAPKTLSKTINQGFSLNFYEFVSQYRIDEAKRMLENPKNQKTILEIMYEVGFNSKSVFNTAFKKATGMTPSEYRKSIHA